MKDMKVEELKEILEILVDDQLFLAALFEAGVEGWEGFEKANEIYEMLVEDYEDSDEAAH